MSNIVYIHKGYSWYIPLALINAKRQALGSVYYIGDYFGCQIARLYGAKSLNISKFNHRANQFAAIYRHHSTLGIDFELFCIQRWFILCEFMEYQKMNQCIYLDTDNLIAKDLDSYYQETLNYSLAFSGYGAHVCFVNRLEGLQTFCNFIIKLYSDINFEEKLIEWQKSHVSYYGGGGVSDMTLFYWFWKENPEIISDYKSIFGESPFDLSLEDTRNFKPDKEGFKKIFWVHQIPFGIKNDNSLVEFATLHHQGIAKKKLKLNAAYLGIGWFQRQIIAPSLGIIYRFLKRMNFEI
jgi:hypothetical protein